MSDTITANNAVNMSETPTTEVKFKALPSMEKWLDTAIELATDNKSEIAEACGIDRTTWYDWLEKPGFEDWYYEQYKNKRKRWLPTLDKIGMKNAQRDYNFWKDMRKAAGESNEDSGAKVQINNIIGVKRDEYGF